LAGSVLLKPAHLTSLTELNETIHANLLTAFGVVRCAAPRMFGSGGSIVLMSSAAAHIGLSNHEAIAMCKSGIDGLVKSAAATYASRKICVNAIAPGLVRTPLTERIWNNARAAESSTSLHPLGRLGEPSDVAEAIGWLIDPKQTWITGQSIGVDGGLGSLKTMAARPAG
jgi:NAD(P)-dependent dehydrogenase (short-subunit alcohol dehydrogenase family)